MLRLLSRPAARYLSAKEAQWLHSNAIRGATEAEGSTSATSATPSQNGSPSSSTSMSSFSDTDIGPVIMPDTRIDTFRGDSDAKRDPQLVNSIAPYRVARSRLWTPSSEILEDSKSSGSDEESIDNLDEESALDRKYESIWNRLTPEKQNEESLRAWFQCIRRLGWRKGYSRGYPTREMSEILRKERAQNLIKLSSPARSEVKEAMEAIANFEESSAWQAWKSMSSVQRNLEAKVAWDNRDRSMIYIDDTSKVLGTNISRWFHQPQPVGSMTFLPNVIVRLVRNQTRRNGEYDAFKATFRIPLSMHKHNLKSYLLAIYGLRTTWCRSTIHRARVLRSRVGGRLVVGPSSQTFKKVEVGLLEPFVFPEITANFLKTHMMNIEFSVAQRERYFAMSGRRRWRTRAPVNFQHTDSSGAAIDEESIIVMRREDGQRGSEIQEKKPNELPSIFRKAGIVTSKQSTILRLVHKKRLAKEAEVAAKMKELRLESESSKVQKTSVD